MVSVFAAIIFSDGPMLKKFGVMLAIGIVIDAFLMRMTLVTELMSRLDSPPLSRYCATRPGRPPRERDRRSVDGRALVPSFPRHNDGCMKTQQPKPSTHKTALVTGGNRGLGRSSALHLAEDGVDVILTYRSHPDEAEAVVALIQSLGRAAVALRLDTSRPESFGPFADTVTGVLTASFGADRLDILVNNAGHSVPTRIGQTRLEDVRSLLDVHIVGTVMLTEALLPLLADGGRIVNTSSGLTRFAGDDGYSVYGAAKGAVEVYTRYLAKALGPRRITANAIAPGATGTDFGGGSLRDNEQARAGLSSVIAMGRVGEPDDIGAVVASLCSDAMGWVTGQRLEASGGMLL